MLPEIFETAFAWQLFGDVSWLAVPFVMSLTTMHALGEQYGCCLCWPACISSRYSVKSCR